MVDKPATDVRNSLISPNDTLHFLQEVFYDTILLDSQLTIQSIGKHIISDLGYSKEELKSKSVEIIIPDFAERAFALLQTGFFSQQRFHLVSKTGDLITVNLSGFYSGLLTDVNGFVVLRYDNLSDTHVIQDQLNLKAEELDHFIYQASHSLRGPLATIRGLINIAKIEKDPTQLIFIHNQLEEFSNRLDAKLYKLMCFAEADRTRGIPTGLMCPAVFTNKLKQVIEQHTIKMVFKGCFVAGMATDKLNEHLIESIITNLINFLFIDDHSAHGTIEVHVIGGTGFVEIIVKITGFCFGESFQKSLTGDHGYGHLLEQPNLTGAYSVRKVVHKLQGKISFTQTAAESSIHVKIPYSSISLK